MNEATPAQWAHLYAQIKRARIAAGWPKRAPFAREIRINDSTVAIAEGDRPGKPPSDEMLDYITSRVGWGDGTWRRVLSDPEGGHALTEQESVGAEPDTDAVEDDGSDIRYRRPEGVSDQQWARIRELNKAYHQALIDQAASERM